MGTLSVISGSDDTHIEWDTRQAASGDPEAEAAMREAERVFYEHQARGASAFKINCGDTAECIVEFDRTAEQIIVVPGPIGGRGRMAPVDGEESPSTVTWADQTERWMGGRSRQATERRRMAAAGMDA